jgi:soluble lytic murein transglycosylase-like protein
MNNYANNINAQWAPVSKAQPNNEQKTEVQSFEKLLQAGAKTKFGELLTKPSARVNAQIYTNTAQGVTPKGNDDPKVRIKELISRVSQKYGVDEKLVNALVNQESGFNPNATSHCGAMGLMQLMPSTAQGLGVKDAYNPEQNIEGGTKYLKGLMDRFGNDKQLALAAYNAGPNAVKKYGGIPPYAETQNYVKKVLSKYDTYKGAN